MSSNGPLIEPDVLRKKVSGMVSGLRPASLTWLAKLVICATTRQGAVTGDTRSRVAGSTVCLLARAASICSRLGEQLAGGRGVGVDAGRRRRGCGPTRRRRCAGW